MKTRGGKEASCIPRVPQAITYLPVRFRPRPHPHASVGGQPRGTGKAVVTLVGRLRKWRLGDVRDVTWECSFVLPVGGCGSAPAPCVQRGCPVFIHPLLGSEALASSCLVSPTPHLDNQRRLSLTPALVLELPATTVVVPATTRLRWWPLTWCPYTVPARFWSQRTSLD